MRKLFEKVMDKCNYTTDYNYDWSAKDKQNSLKNNYINPLISNVVPYDTEIITNKNQEQNNFNSKVYNNNNNNNVVNISPQMNTNTNLNNSIIVNNHMTTVQAQKEETVGNNMTHHLHLRTQTNAVTNGLTPGLNKSSIRIDVQNTVNLSTIHNKRSKKENKCCIL